MNMMLVPWYSLLNDQYSDTLCITDVERLTEGVAMEELAGQCKRVDRHGYDIHSSIRHRQERRGFWLLLHSGPPSPSLLSSP